MRSEKARKIRGSRLNKLKPEIKEEHKLFREKVKLCNMSKTKFIKYIGSLNVDNSTKKYAEAVRKMEQNNRNSKKCYKKQKLQQEKETEEFEGKKEEKRDLLEEVKKLKKEIQDYKREIMIMTTNDVSLIAMNVMLH